MELRQLKYFVAVAEEGSFTRAAARLYVAQPGVSAQVRRLEQELGEALLDRSGRTVRLTEVGAAVLPHARAALDGVADMRLTVDEFTGLIRGRIAIGMVTSCSSLELPALLADFHKDHPAVEMTLIEADSDQLLDELRNGRLDMAVVGMAVIDSAAAALPGIATHVIADEPLVIAVGPDDPLAGHATISLPSLRDRALISLPRGTGLRACLDEACAAAGFEPHVAFEASDPRILAQLAIRGLGAALLPASLAAAHADRLHAIEVIGAELRGRLAFAWREEETTSPAARAFIDHARIALTDPRAGRELMEPSA